MTEKSDNPAGRLHALLTSALRFQDSKTAREVWSNVFEIAPGDTSHLLSLYGKLIDLIADARESVDKLEGVEKTIYLQPFDEIDKAFSYFNLDAAWQPTRQHLTEATMRSLAFAADTLAGAQWTTEIEQADLDDLLEEANAVLEAVTAADIGDELKSYLSESLQNIQRAIIEYKIRGVAGLQEALDISIGAARRHKGAIEKALDKKPVKKWGAFLARMDQVVSLALKIKQLAGPVIQFLESPPD